jgi:hypothetical protein
MEGVKSPTAEDERSNHHDKSSQASQDGRSWREDTDKIPWTLWLQGQVGL